jgi:cation transport ATPase
MGMKEYKFLRRSRDLIVKSEQKISRINNKMSKIEQEVVDLKSKKKKLRLPKTEDWKKNIDEQIKSEEEKYEHNKQSQEAELEEIQINKEKSENRSQWEFLIGIGIIFGSFIPMWAMVDYGVSELYYEVYTLGCMSYWIWIFFYGGGKGYGNPDVVIKKYNLSKQESEINKLKEAKSSYLKDVSINENSEKKLIECKAQVNELINQKDEIANTIKATWKDVNHLVPRDL